MMPSRPQWIRFFYADFSAAVAVYSATVAGAYIRALCYYWQVTNCNGIEDNSGDMQSLCGLNSMEWEKHGRIVFGKLFTLDGQGLWQQKRAKEEWDRAIVLANKRSEIGKLASYRRWNK